MKKLLLLSTLLLPGLANASLLYTYEQDHLNNQTFIVSGDVIAFSYLKIGTNDFDLGWDNESLYYKWDIDIDPENTTIVGDFQIVGVRNGFWGVYADGFDRPRDLSVTGRYDTETLVNLYYSEGEHPLGYEYEPWLNDDGWYLGLYLVKDGYYYMGEELQIAFGDNNVLTMTNRKADVVEPYTAALFGLPLALLGFRRFKRK